MKFEFLNPLLRQKAAQLLAFEDAASSVPQVERGSKILKDIRSGLIDSKPVATPRASEFSQSSLSYRLDVGARLGVANRRPLESATRLIALVAQQLPNQACKVAFVGQVKAGKSSLINVLVEQSNLCLQTSIYAPQSSLD
jgi:ribosome biogenesis GTPase A